MNKRLGALCALLLVATAVSARADATVVFSEIMYHPLTNESALEWVELHSEMAVDMDISGWSLDSSIHYTFQEGTIITGGGYLVVAISPTDLIAATGLTNVFGPFTGRLANGGEKVELRNNNGRLMDQVSYDVDGDWPVGPDGTGVTLAKRADNLASEKAGSWHMSAQAGGTPGAANFPQGIPSTPTLAFNEVSPVTGGQFWVEILNYGTQSVVMNGLVLGRFSKTYREYVIPTQTLPAGGYLLLTKAAVGFGADPGDRLVLYGPGKSAVYDAVVAKKTLRGRYPEGTGDWLYPNAPTSSASNTFAFHDEIVINEIMYHARDAAAAPATYFTNTLLTMTNVWRYSQLGATPAPDWQTADYDDSLWPVGEALFYNTSSALPAPKNTLLTLSNANQRIITYYFRAPFVLSSDPAGLQLALRHIVDEGAVFYLNGVEIYRYNLPSGSIGYNTLATSSFGVPTNAGPFLISVTNLVVGINTLAVEVHQYSTNNPVLDKDMVFGAELMAVGIATPARAAGPSPEAWVELYNRSTNTVDLTNWRLDSAIHFAFPTNQTIAPGGYLVVAEDAAFLRGLHPAIEILGDFSGSLSHGGESVVLKDASDNPVSALRYFDGAPWPEFTDGQGASLELRDPRADNSRPEAWAASDERSRSQWFTCTYRGTAVVETASSPTQWKEFVLGLPAEGEALLDDISVIEAPSGAHRQLIQNGSFETGLTAWRLLGTHGRSGVIVDPDNTNNHVLHLIANGDTEHMHNHIETTLASGVSITNGVEYEISFRARWIAGCNKLNTRLYFNRLARVTELPMPEFAGTPGARNSCYATNIGPTFSGFGHAPIVPTNNQPVTVSVTAQDPDGVSLARLWWSTNGSSWSQTNLASQSNGLFQGNIPGYPSGALVQFYVEATDGLGAKSTYPAGGTNSRALYRVLDGTALLARVHTIRLLMPIADANFLHAATNVMSNERLGCTVIYDERQAFYGASLHLQGSERGRNTSSRVGFTVRMPADNLFRGVLDGFTIDCSGGYSGKGGDQDEILIKHAVNKAGGLPGMYDDLCQVLTPRSQENGTGLLILAKYGPEFLDSQYKNGGDGEMHKLELIYYPTTTVSGDPQSLKLPQPDNVLGTDIKDLGDDPESYRWTFLKENHSADNNYAPMMALAKAFSLTGTNLQTQLPQVMDVDEWMRAVAFLSLIGSDDGYTYGNSHNLIIYFRPTDLKGMAFLWDMDYEFVASITKAFPGNGSANTYKIITTIPANLRLYLGHLRDLAAVTGNSTYMSRWATHYAGLLGQNWSQGVDYLSQRAAWVLTQLPAQIPFSTTNHGGNSFTSALPSIQLGGTAWIDVKEIGLAGSTNRFALTWLTTSNWLATVTLDCGSNALNILAYDFHGNVIASNLLGVTLLDLEAPVIVSCVPDTVLAVETNCLAALPELTGLIMASDNCSLSATQWPPAGTWLALGTTQVVFTVFDGSGNTARCTNIVTVADQTPPTLTCPANILASAAPGQCSAVLTLGVSATDNCDPAPVMVCSPTNGSAFPVGTTTVTCQAHDASFNTNICAFTVTVTDAENPHLTCPGNLSLAADPGQCGKSNVAFTVTATDNCAVTNLSCAPPSGSAFAMGSHPVTCTATDASGNTAQCAFTVTVTDNENPQINCPASLSFTADSGQPSKSNVTFTATATDNCAVTNVSCVPPSGSTFPAGTNLVNCTATDSSGRSAACSFSVTVEDTGLLSVSATDVVNLRIPDGSPVGLVGSVNLTTPIERITNVAVALHVTGGFNGDLHAYLVHDSGHAVLLNRPGKTLANPSGYSDAGLDITFADTAASGDVHSYRQTLFGNPGIPLGGPLTSAWAPDGRDADPALVLDSTPRPATLGSFLGLNPNGRWTLFIADVDAVYSSTLVSWGLEVRGTNAPPVITAQPQSRTNAEGATATFSVTATTLSPPGYQWFKSVVSNQWSVISNGTNATLALPSVRTTNAGDYRVVVTSLGGSVTSQVATLTVLTLQVTGQVALEAYAGPAHDGRGSRPVTFKATDDAGLVLATWSPTLTFAPGAGGGGVAGFTLDNVPVGTTHVSAKTAWHLRQRRPVTFTGRAALADFTGAGALPGGDLTGWNHVGLEDYFHLAASWYRAESSADIDGSGFVDLDDYLILSNNWDAEGDGE